MLACRTFWNGVTLVLLLPACGPSPRPLPLLAGAPATAPAAANQATLPDANLHAPSPGEPQPVKEAPAALPQPEPAPALPARRGNMLLVPAGSLRMGLPEGGQEDERPVHSVSLPAFYLDETEVTNAAYAEAVAAKVCTAPYAGSAAANGFGSDRRFRGPQQPVSSISWDNARAYCEWRGKRLPSEAEWERAARGDDGRRYPWGDEAPTPQHARYRSAVTAEVATHAAGIGPFGHHDLAGNVWEWVEDVYDPYAYRRAGAATGELPTCALALAAQDDLRANRQQGFTGSNPIPTTCERVLRGGAFNYFPSGLRSSNRVHHPPRYRLVMSGFRCAQDAGENVLIAL